MAAAVVTVVVLVLVPAAAAGTANSRRSDLLPEDCGRRLMSAAVGRPLIADPTNSTGNTTAYYGQFPWQARIVVYKRKARGYVHQCGGIIITPRHVLTAAHCVDRVALRRVVVRVGDWRFGAYDSAEQEFGVAYFRAHRHFGDSTALANDIALLLLKVRRGDGIEFGWFVQPACLPEADTKYETDTECEVSGWGKTADGAPISETLRGVSVPLVTDPFCSSEEVYHRRFVSGRMFCAGLVRGGPDSCGGDSGGPLVCRDPVSDRFVAFGIVSTGDLRGCGLLPGLYTKLSGFTDWLLPLLQLDHEQDPWQPLPQQNLEEDLSLPLLQQNIEENLSLPIIQQNLEEEDRSLPILRLDDEQDSSADLEADCGRAGFSTLANLPDTFTAESQDDLPWLVTIHGATVGHLSCPGTVVSRRRILVAGSCVHYFRDSLRTARPGIRRLNGTDVKFDILRAVRYPGGGPVTDTSGMALLETSAPIPSSSGVRPVCLLDRRRASEVTVGPTLLLASRGFHLDTFDASPPPPLRVKQVPAADVVECSRYCRRAPDPNSGEPPLRDGHAVLREETFCMMFSPKKDVGEFWVKSRPLMAELKMHGVRRWFAVGLMFFHINVHGCQSGSISFQRIE